MPLNDVCNKHACNFLHIHGILWCHFKGVMSQTPPSSKVLTKCCHLEHTIISNNIVIFYHVSLTFCFFDLFVIFPIEIYLKKQKQKNPPELLKRK